MVRKGEEFVCESCGMEITCTKDCGCSAVNLACCGVPMKKKAGKKTKTVKKKATRRNASKKK